VTRLNRPSPKRPAAAAADWHVLHLTGENGMADAGAARQALPEALRRAMPSSRS
jgi:hypothetical protein